MFGLVSSQLRSNSVSVVFDFSASLNDFVPASPTQLPIECEILKCDLSMDILYAFCVYESD